MMKRLITILTFLTLLEACWGQIVMTGNHRHVFGASGPSCSAALCSCTVVGSQLREFCTSNVTWHAITNGSNITVEAIGGGGGGEADGVSQRSGGGGEYAASTTVTYTSGSNISITVGAGGLGSLHGANTSTNGGTSSFGATIIAVGGKAGHNGSTGGTGGTGVTLYNGGAGVVNNSDVGPGGGGAAGPNGVGGAGNSGPGGNNYGGGGGGSGGGSAGGTCQGGANYIGSVAGGACAISTSSNGSPGGGDMNGASGGGGGGFSSSPSNGGVGGAGLEWGLYGSGGGGGGGGSEGTGANWSGGAGGLYGGGGGSGGYNIGTSAAGAQGIVVITYTPPSSVGIARVGTPVCNYETSSTTIPLSYVPTAGNTLIVVAGQYGVPTVTSVTTNNSQSFTSLAASSSNYNSSIWGLLSVSSGTTTITVHESSPASQYQAACVAEYSGVLHFGSVPEVNNVSASPYANTLTTTTGTNNWFVSALATGASSTFTATTGSIFNQYSTAYQTIAITDNSATAYGVPISLAGTFTGGSVASAAGIELKSQ